MRSIRKNIAARSARLNFRGVRLPDLNMLIEVHKFNDRVTALRRYSPFNPIRRAFVDNAPLLM